MDDLAVLSQRRERGLQSDVEGLWKGKVEYKEKM